MNAHSQMLSMTRTANPVGPGVQKPGWRREMILPKLEDNSAQSGACSDCSECAYDAFKNVEEPDWLCVGHTYHGPSMSVTLITPSQALGWGRRADVHGAQGMGCTWVVYHAVPSC